MAEVKYNSFVSTKEFPKNFLFGTATGAFQVEGAWDEDKSPSIWDDYFHSNQVNKSFRYYLDLPMHVIEDLKRKGIEPRIADLYKGMRVYEVPSNAVVDGTRFDFNGDIAADTYHKTDEDVKLLKELGVQVYRFSIAPTRIIPNIHDHSPGQKGLDYYNHLIDKLIENGITPMVSLYHYDMAVHFNLLGGLTNYACYPFYEHYTRLCFEKFGDRVKYWTASADIHLAAEGYGSEHFAPGYQETVFSGYSDYKSLHHSFITCAVVYRIYNEEFKKKQQGEVGFSIDGTWFYPKDPNNQDHQKIAENARMSTFGLIMYVIMTGQYPPQFFESVDRESKRKGIRIKRVEPFKKEEQELIKGCFDFIILNYYSSVKVRPLTEEELAKEPNLKRRDRGYFMDFDVISPDEVYEGFLNCLKYTNDVMNKPKILIGENGFPEEEGLDNSIEKIAYHTGILNKLLEALDNNINIFGYCVWSFLDTLEFAFGYRKRFGIYAVDVNDKSRPRSKKKSFPFFQQLFTSKKLQIRNEE